MITCKRCGKENQDHYKFCLGCGAELEAPSVPAAGPPPAGPAPAAGGGGVAMMKTVMADMNQPPPSAPRPAPSPTPPGGAGQPAGGALPGMSGGMAPTIMPSSAGASQGAPPPAAPAPAPAAAPAPAPAPAPQAAAGPRACPSCGASVQPGFKFCGQCGFKMPDEAPVRATGDIAQQASAEVRPRGALVLIRPDGSEGGTHALEEGENKIGRNHGAIFENDGYLSPTHAELVVNAAGAVVRDLDSLNGVFVRMTEEEALRPGQIFRVGQELLRFDLIEAPQTLEDGTEIMGSPNPGYWGKLSVVIGEGVDGSAFPLLGDSTTIGRERGDINFPDDGYVSGLHARLSTRNGQAFLADLGSSNGTFLRIDDERSITPGSFVLLGQQLFRVDLRG